MSELETDLQVVLTTSQAADLLQCSQKTILGLIHAGVLRARKLRREWRICAADVYGYATDEHTRSPS